jgi:hypothetical protein
MAACLELEVIEALDQVGLERGVAQVGDDPGQQILIVGAKVVVEPPEGASNEHLTQFCKVHKRRQNRRSLPLMSRGGGG